MNRKNLTGNLAYLLVITLFTVGCGNGKLKDRLAGNLPPAASMYLPLPGEDESSSSQALCASDDETEAYDDFKEWVDEHNDTIQNQIALMKTMLRMSARKLQNEGEYEYVVEKEERSLTLNAQVSDNDVVTYQAVFSGPNVTDYEFLNGTANAERTEGSWNIFSTDGEEIVKVTWTSTDELLTVIRERLDRGRTVTFTRDAAVANVEFEGANRNATATWNVETYNGSFEILGQEKVCWEHLESDFCAVTCSED